MIDDNVIEKYRKVIARVEKGSTDNEKATAARIAKSMREKYPGIESARLSTETPKPPPPPPKSGFKPSSFSDDKKRSVVEDIIEEILRRSAPPADDVMEDVLDNVIIDVDANSRFLNVKIKIPVSLLERVTETRGDAGIHPYAKEIGKQTADEIEAAWRAALDR